MAVVRSVVRETAAGLVPSLTGTAPPVDGCSTPAAPPAIDAFLPLVRTIARMMSHGLPAVVELDDLVHDGVVGLLECARRFDPSRGVNFRTYASYRIRGAILDGLRARDPLPRSVRRALKAADHSGGSPNGAGSGNGARPRPIPFMTQLLSLADAGPLPEDSTEPEEELLAEELREAVRRAVATLPGRDREILHLRFTREMRLREVSAYYGISITRVAELQERAIRRLRVALDVPRPAELSPNGRRRRRRGG